MILFHKLSEEDQHNSIHYCMHIVIEDMLEDGVQLEPFSEEDRKMKETLEKVIKEAQALPTEERFDYAVNHAEAGQMIFDIALDMARSAFYPSDDELVIHYESLRQNIPQPEQEEVLELAEIETNKKPNNSLN